MEGDGIPFGGWLWDVVADCRQIVRHGTGNPASRLRRPAGVASHLKEFVYV